MNDNDLITVVRESFAGVHTTTAMEQIVSRGRVVRARRRIPRLAGALAVAGGAALAATMLLPGSHQGGQPGVQLAAWTVTRQADGTIRVTIRELRDPAGLQSKLRADGIPASVTLIGQENPSCRPYPASPALRKRVLSITPGVVPSQHQGPSASTSPPEPNLVLVFHINRRRCPAASAYSSPPPSLRSPSESRIKLSGPTLRWWAWPLPPAGPLEFVCQWPMYGIAETRVSIDAQLILDAARRSVRLWPADQG